MTVLDVNDFRPRFLERVFSTSVFENEPSGTSVITLTATDLDEGDNGILTYTLKGNGAGNISEIFANIAEKYIKLINIYKY